MYFIVNLFVYNIIIIDLFNFIWKLVLILLLILLLFCCRSDGNESKKSNSKHENDVKYGELIILG